MSLWRQLTRGLRALTQRTAADQDVADEVAHYFEQATSELEASGLSPEEARRTARLQLGQMEVVREQVRTHGWEHRLETIVADLRYGARRLRAHPGFTIVCASTLALGIGASTAIFSAVNPILFEPLPYPHADRIAMIWDIGSYRSLLDVTFGTYREVAERSRSFDALAVMRPWQPTLSGATRSGAIQTDAAAASSSSAAVLTASLHPERLDGQRVSADYFRVLGESPVLGRDFEPADDRRGGPRVVILGDGLWRRRFNGDPAIVGREIALDDDRYTVIGVMPRAFENVLAASAEVWAPLQYDVTLPITGREWGHHLRMVGRMRPGLKPDQARADVDAIARTPVQEFARAPWAALGSGFIVNALQDDVTQAVRPALMAILGAVLLVLAIACVNVTNLLLARAAQRRGEFAMRAALGAGRTRLIQQLIAESLLLAAIGGILGMAVAEIGVGMLLALSPSGLPRADAIGVNRTVFGFAVAITAVIGVAVGLIPALHASRGDLHSGLQGSSRRAAGGHNLTRRTLVIAEVALALVLLAGAGLLMRSLQQLFAVAPGFQPSRVLTMQVQASGHRFDDAETTHRFFAEALDAVRQVPGVSAAAFTSQLPLSGDFDVYGVEFERAAESRSDEDRGGFRYAVSAGYFETLGIPLRSGRLFDARDLRLAGTGGAPLVAIINESFAKRRFPGTDPINQRLRLGDAKNPWHTIIGIVGDVKQMSLTSSRADAVYIPSTQWRFVDKALWLVVRTDHSIAAGAPAFTAAFIAKVRDAIWSVDKDQPVVRVAWMDDLLAATAAERRFALVLFQAFGGVALLLAAVGIYGVLSGSVTERMREIGVRAALGASRASILALIVRQGLTLTVLGVVIGLAAALIASRALVTLLFGISRLDPLTYVGVVALLLGVSAMACWIPARRASWVDPAITLRAE